MASDFDTLTTTARNSKWENNAPGKVLPMPQKVSSKSISGKMDIYPQKDSHAERNNGEQNKVKPSHKVLREKSIPNSNATMPDLSSSFVNAMFNGIKYNGLNIPQNFTDPSSSAVLNAAYLNAFGLPPFSPLPLQFNPGNIAVASVMPNALETLAAQLGSIGHQHMPPSPHSPCTSPSDFNPSNVFSNASMRSRMPSFINDYHDQQLSNYLRFYSNSLNPLIAGQDNATFPKPSSSRKHPMPKSDKSRKEQAVETSRSSGVSTLDKTNYLQNGDEILSYGRQTSSKPKLPTDVDQQSDITRRSYPHKLPVLPSKDQKGRVSVPQNEGSRSAEHMPKHNHHNKPVTPNRLTVRSKTANTLKPKDFGDEEAAAILLHLSSATESECVKETSVQDKCKRVVAQQPIDYSARTAPHKESTNCKRWSNPNLSFQTVSKNNDNSQHNPNKDKLNPNKQMVDNISPNSELVLSDNEYTYELNSDDSKNQPGGFNFKKVICKKFTAERDPNDSTEVADGDNSINEQNKQQSTSDLQHADRNMTNFNRLQYDPVNNMAKTTASQSHSFKEKCVKSHPKRIHGKIKPPSNHNHISSNKKYIKPSRSDYNNSKTSDKPHINAQSFSDLRAISKHFQTNNPSTKSTHRTGAKGLYRDAFGGSSDSMESVGESENEDKEDDESESESSSEEESDEEEGNEEESDASEKDVFPRSSWNDENSPIKRRFSLSRPKFTLSKATFQSNDHQNPAPAQQPIVSKEQDNSTDQSRFTIRSPTFKFSKLSNESKLKANEARTYSTHSNKSGGGFKQRVKIMPRVSAITLPKPRLAARASKNVDKSRKFATLPELKLEDGSKSSLKALFMQALNKSGETGGKPVGIPVDHKSLKAIGLGTTSYFLHNNKKYILRRALAKKKVVSAKQSGKETVKETFTVKNKSKYIIQQVPSTKNIRREATACKGDNEVNNAEQAKRNDANNDQLKKISKPSSAKRRKRSLDFIPTITCDDDCDIFSKVKLRHRTSLHNLAKDNSNASNSNVKQNNTISAHTVTHHSRKRQWHKHAKRSLKSSTDLFLLNQLTYSKSVARAKKICMRRNENLRKNSMVIRKNDFNKRPSHSVRIMAGATRPSYQILRQIRETKDENNNLLEARKVNDESHNAQVDKMEIETEKNEVVANTEITQSIEIVAKTPTSPQHGNNFEVNPSEKNVGLVNTDEKNCSKNTVGSTGDDLISGVGDDVIITIKQESNCDGTKVNRLKRKAAVSSRPKPSNESFKLLSFFTNPPTMSLDPAYCGVQPSYNMWIPSNELHKPSVNKNSLLNWKFGENAVEIKQQQQRDEWKSMTVNTFPNA